MLAALISLTMSRRAIKRYEESLAAQRSETHDDSEEEVEQGSVDIGNGRVTAGSSGGGGPLNMFGALLGDDDGVEDNEDLEDSDDGRDNKGDRGQEEDKGIAERAAVGGPKETGSGNAGADGAGKKKRKKRKKKGKKTAEDDEDWFVGDTGNQQTLKALGASDETELLKDPAHIPDVCFAPEDDDELREIARQVMRDVMDIAYPDGVIPGELEALARASRELVVVNPQMLKAETELKRLFGTRVVDGERVAEEIEEAQLRRRRGGGGPRMKRKVHLVQPRETWWPSAPGFGMVLDDASNKIFRAQAMEGEESVRYFRFNHEPRYEVIQQDYRAIVQTHNPNMLVGLINRFPYHVDTLLQLGEVYRQTGEFDRAGELVDRALFVLESTWHRAFKPFSGDCRMSHSVAENGSFFFALFWHVQLLTRRGLFRTALESGKLLLNLDPPFDPMGILMLLDTLALKCGEYGWVRAMHRDYYPCPLEFFPNFAISAAVAAHKQEERQQLQKSGTRASGSKTKKNDDRTEFSVLASEQDVTPLQQLSFALLTFPMALQPILMTLEQEGTHVCDKYELFRPDVGMEDDDVLPRLCRIYAVCSKELWTGSTLQLLRDASVCAGAAAAGGRGSEGLELAEKGAVLRTEAVSFFRRSEAYDHLLIADFSSSETNIPAELMGADGPEPEFAEDPTMRDNAIDMEGGAEDAAPQATQASDSVSEVTRPASTAETALAFFRSFLPWYTAPEAENETSTDAAQDQLGPDAWNQLQHMMERRENNEDSNDGEAED